MKKILIALVMVWGVAVCASAQLLFGNTGHVAVPTADMQEEGTFVTGATFLPDSYLDGFHKYNTGMYYFTLTPFSWVELSFRETLAKSRKKYVEHQLIPGEYLPNGDPLYADVVVYGKKGFYTQDRSYSVRLRPIREKEGKWWPSVVVGCNDPWSDNGGSYYSCAYGVVTKHLNVKGIGRFDATAGYYKSFGDRFGDVKAFDGVFGGIGYIPAFWDQMLVSADYDTQGINLGMNVRLFNHWNILVYERDFEKFGFGMSYQYTIKY